MLMLLRIDKDIGNAPSSYDLWFFLPNSELENLAERVISKTNHLEQCGTYLFEVALNFNMSETLVSNRISWFISRGSKEKLAANAKQLKSKTATKKNNLRIFIFIPCII
jgi:hypothetical protein